jgi:hypothetical protein
VRLPLEQLAMPLPQRGETLPHLRLGAAQLASGEPESRDAAAPTLVLGAAGLLATNRGLLDRDAMAGKAASGRKPLTRRALDAITSKWFGGGATAQAPAQHRDSDEPAAGERRSRIEW